MQAVQMTGLNMVVHTDLRHAVTQAQADAVLPNSIAALWLWITQRATVLRALLFCIFGPQGACAAQCLQLPASRLGAILVRSGQF